MFIAFYTVNPDDYTSPKSYVVRIFRDDILIRTVSFPICNPHNRVKTLNQAYEFGRLAVREIMDKELAK
ncbi:hypothetical protein BWD09_02325 [Neisseria dentiae]|uniref:Uncharacterized protein n=1 Tax=Neisseria dentiae TaxID=194197 RepID=A0A1X3DFA3_9NEIS|nr:hypothetical protein [Neisseria dentiae]OSI18619.1 hypothetical protein BWD09_02325 [Neisseria dentiae]QMT45490.1 hypothetical protein H3L92_01295 [Neisseria dentiae]STZ51362.1 Uncharacterised protein [Neisseria dentiae]